MTQFKKARELPVVSEAPWDDDVFETLQDYATFLTNALIADPGPFVLNVNGAWGSGKTFFVRRWAADLRNQGYPVVEFNAWENDAADDPLAPLMACFIEAQSEILPKEKAEKFKQVCGKYILAGGGLIVRAGLKEFLGEKGIDQINDLLDSDAENELIELAGKHIDEQLAKQKAAKGLHGLLTAFVESVREKQGTELPIFFFIDELDRCRPTFAIELLERVKHLFNVDGIKFIVSTDSEQLVHSINGVYGTRFDGFTYLRRFFDETFTLPVPDHEQFATRLFKTEKRVSFEEGELPSVVFKEHANAFRLSLRDQIQLFHRIQAILANLRQRNVFFIPLCFLSAMRLKRPADYLKLTDYSHCYRHWSSIVDEFGFSQKSTTSILLDVMFRYLEAGRVEAQKDYQTRPNSDPGSRNEQEWEADECRRAVLNHYDLLKAYPRLIELTAQLD